MVLVEEDEGSSPSSSLDNLLRRRKYIVKEVEDNRPIEDVSVSGGGGNDKEETSKKRKGRCCGLCREILPLLCLLTALLTLFLAGVTLSFYLTGLGFVIIDQENAWQMTPWKGVTNVLLSYQQANNTIYSKTDSLVLNLKFFVSTYVPSLIPLYLWHDHLSLRYIPLGTTSMTSILSSCILNKLTTYSRHLNQTAINNIKTNCRKHFTKLSGGSGGVGEGSGSSEIEGLKDFFSAGGEASQLDMSFMNPSDARGLAEKVEEWFELQQKLSEEKKSLLQEPQVAPRFDEPQPLFQPMLRPEAISKGSGSSRYIWPKKIKYLKNKGSDSSSSSSSADISWDSSSSSSSDSLRGTQSFVVQEELENFLLGGSSSSSSVSSKIDELWEQRLEEHFSILERHISQNHSQGGSGTDLQKFIEDKAYVNKFKQPTSVTLGLPYNATAKDTSAILSSLAMAKINLCRKEAEYLIKLGIRSDWQSRPTCGEAFLQLSRLNLTNHQKLLPDLLTATTTSELTLEYILPEQYREAIDPFNNARLGRGTSSFLDLKLYQDIPLTPTAPIYDALRRDCELWTFALFQLRFEGLSPCPICSWVMAKQNYHCPFLVPCDVNDLVAK